MLRSSLLLFVALTSVVAFSSAVAAPPGSPRDRDAVVRYWTPDRIAKAKPREVTPAGVFPGPSAGGPNKPGGGSGTSTSTGAKWTGGGAVKQTTGKVLFTMAATDYVCSGAVVQDGVADRSIVLTAGHCVYDETNRAFATNWMFVPNYEDGGSIITNPDGSHSFSCTTVPYGCWTAEALVTTTVWANGSGSLSSFKGDYGFAVMSLGGKTGQELELDNTVGSNPIAFNQAHPTAVYAFGYPQASPYNGQSLIFCNGTDQRDTWGGSTNFGLNCNMTGGSSGGPWFVNFNRTSGTGTLNSVNSFRYTAGPLSKNMFGPYFDSYTQKTFESAKASSGDLLISP